MADKDKETQNNVEFANKPKLFGRWDYDEVKTVDPCFKDYIAINTTRT